MSSLVRMCPLVLLVALALSSSAQSESYSADLTSSKIVGTSLRVYTVANPGSKDLIETNMKWAKTQITDSKKFVGGKTLSKAMKLKAASDSYDVLLNALIKLWPAIEDADLKKAARNRLLTFKTIVDTGDIDQITKTISEMELEMASAINAYNAF